MALPFPEDHTRDLTRAHRRLGGEAFRFLKEKAKGDPDLIEWALHVALTDVKAYRKQFRQQKGSSNHECNTCISTNQR